MSTYTTRQIHLAIRQAAEELWKAYIEDFDDSLEILRMFHAIGWNWIHAYKNSEKFAWCGVFAGVCCLNARYFLEEGLCANTTVDFDIARVVMPSTVRLDSLRKWQQATAHGPIRFLPEDVGPDALIPGAIVTIAARNYGDYRDTIGGHIVIVDSYEGGDTFTTIEGNAHGTFPDEGLKGEGVVKRTRNTSDIRRVYHLRPEHLETFDV